MTNVKCTVVPDSCDIIFFYNMQFSFKKHLFFSANSSKMNLFELFSEEGRDGFEDGDNGGEGESGDRDAEGKKR